MTKEGQVQKYSRNDKSKDVKTGKKNEDRGQREGKKQFYTYNVLNRSVKMLRLVSLLFYHDLFRALLQQTALLFTYISTKSIFHCKKLKTRKISPM